MPELSLFDRVRECVCRADTLSPEVCDMCQIIKPEVQRLKVRVAELEAMNRDYQAEMELCFDLAQRMDAMNPDAPGAFTGTPSERLTRAFERLTK